MIRPHASTRGEHGEEYCAGAVSRVDGRPDRLLLGADRGSWCLDFHLAELGWELDGDQLRLPREHFRGPMTDAVLWTTKPLTRLP